MNGSSLRPLPCIALLLAFSLSISCSAAQAPPATDPPAPQTPDVQTSPTTSSRAEAPVPGMTRRDPQTVAITLAPPAPGADSSHLRELILERFTFDGDPVATSKLHFRQLAPNVLEITSLAYSLGEWQFRLHDRSNYYGLGERFDRLNHTHTVVRNLSIDNALAKGASTYKPMPFFMSTGGYGLWLDTTSEAVFDLNSADNEAILVSVPATRLRLVVFTDPAFPHQLEAFTRLTQRAVVPPYWAFAPWYGRDAYRDASEVRADVDRARALNLPASVILIDSPWASAYNSYRWNTRQWGDPAAMIRQLHQSGYKLVVWHTPWINFKSDPPGEAGMAGKIDLKSPNYDEAAERGFFVKTPDGHPYVGRWWKGEGSMIDFTNPAAKQWWSDQIRDVVRTGVDGFKDDDAEGSFQGDVRFADSTPRELMRNRYAVLYNNTVADVLHTELKDNGVLFARSTTQGANGLGFLWGGDNESSFSPENGLATVVTAGLNAGMSGMPLWAADIPGYIKAADSPNPEVALRWSEFAAFSPVMESFSSTNLQPWDWDAHWPATQPAGSSAAQSTGSSSTQPAGSSAAQPAGSSSTRPAGTSAAQPGGTARTPTFALDTFRRYAVLHMSLFPYRYAAAQESARTGMPLLRALPLLFQNDRHAREARDEYLFGPDLLVAPVTDANTRRPVYLPAGDWIDFWTGARVSGGQTLVVDAPLETIPVFARAGAVLPEIPEDVMTLVPSVESGNTTVKTLDDRRVFEIIAGTPQTAMHWTDFEGRTLTREANTLRIGAGKDPARITIRWRSEHPANITVDGKTTTATTSPATTITGGARTSTTTSPASATNAGPASTINFALPAGKDATITWH